MNNKINAIHCRRESQCHHILNYQVLIRCGSGSRCFTILLVKRYKKSSLWDIRREFAIYCTKCVWGWELRESSSQSHFSSVRSWSVCLRPGTRWWIWMMPCFGDDADFLTFQLEKGCLTIEGDESKHSVRLPLFLEQNAIYVHQHNHQCICPAPRWER